MSPISQLRPIRLLLVPLYALHIFYMGIIATAASALKTASGRRHFGVLLFFNQIRIGKCPLWAPPYMFTLGLCTCSVGLNLFRFLSKHLSSPSLSTASLVCLFLLPASGLPYTQSYPSVHAETGWACEEPDVTSEGVRVAGLGNKRIWSQ